MLIRVLFEIILTNILIRIKLLLHLANLIQKRDLFIITAEEPVNFCHLNIKENNKEYTVALIGTKQFEFFMLQIPNGASKYPYTEMVLPIISCHVIQLFTKKKNDLRVFLSESSEDLGASDMIDCSEQKTQEY